MPLRAVKSEEMTALTGVPRDGAALTLARLAWTAGFLEGEGTFRHPRSKATTITVSASQVQREPLDRLQAAFGGSLYLKPRSKRDRGVAIHVWTLTGVQAAGLSMTLYVLMSPRRRAQISDALGRWRLRKPQNRHKTHCILGHPFDAANTRWYTNPKSGVRHRWCRACRRERYKTAAA